MKGLTTLLVIALTYMPLTQVEKADLVIRNTLQHEGGFVNHPADPGGATNHGITLRTAQRHLGSNFSVAKLKNMTQPEATQFYRQYFFYANKINELPEEIWDVAFDMYVNHGEKNAVTILQRAVNASGKVKINVDGAMGPNTLNALKTADVRTLRGAVINQRLAFYSAIIRNKPSQKVFAAGWMNRCSLFVTDPKLCEKL